MISVAVLSFARNSTNAPPARSVPSWPGSSRMLISTSTKRTFRWANSPLAPRRTSSSRPCVAYFCATCLQRCGVQRVCGHAAYVLAAASLRVRFEKPDVLARRDLLVEADHRHLNVLPQGRVHSTANTCVGDVLRGQHAPANAMLIVPVACDRTGTHSAVHSCSRRKNTHACRP